MRLKIISILRTLLVAATLLLLGACASSLLGQDEQPPVETYLLEWNVDKSAVPLASSGQSLLVSPVLSNPGYNLADMAYTPQPHQLEYFAHHRWVDTPARMLGPLLVQAASYSGLFSSVAESSSRTRSDLRLDTRLLHLRQEAAEEQGKLRLAVRFSLVDVDRAVLLGSRELHFSEPMATNTPVSGVEAANRAVARLLSALQVYLAEQLAARR